MSECSLLDCDPPSHLRLSVYHWGAKEAEQFKWIESEKAGRDLGESAIRCWVRTHWNGFLRARWLEHLQGVRFWIELDHQDYGLLQRAYRDSALINPILDLLKNGKENLDVILWARKWNQPMGEVIDILEALNINSRRLEFQLENQLINAQTSSLLS
jgi:hypothetical protein